MILLWTSKARGWPKPCQSPVSPYPDWGGREAMEGGTASRLEAIDNGGPQPILVTLFLFPSLFPLPVSASSNAPSRFVLDTQASAA